MCVLSARYETKQGVAISDIMALILKERGKRAGSDTLDRVDNQTANDMLDQHVRKTRTTPRPKKGKGARSRADHGMKSPETARGKSNFLAREVATILSPGQRSRQRESAGGSQTLPRKMPSGARASVLPSSMTFAAASFTLPDFGNAPFGGSPNSGRRTPFDGAEEGHTHSLPRSRAGKSRGAGAGAGAGPAEADRNSLGEEHLAAFANAGEDAELSNASQGGAWMFTQLNGKIQSSRKQTRAAFKALGSIDDVKVQREAEARKAAYAAGAKHVRRHCSTIIDAKETIIDLSSALSHVADANTDADFSTSATWVATIGQCKRRVDSF